MNMDRNKHLTTGNRRAMQAGYDGGRVYGVASGVGSKSTGWKFLDNLISYGDVLPSNSTQEEVERVAGGVAARWAVNTSVNQQIEQTNRDLINNGLPGLTQQERQEML